MTRFLLGALALTASLTVLADQPAQPSGTESSPEVKTLPEVATEDKNNGNSLSATLERGMDNQGLTMEEKWDHDTIVCKRMATSGSRLGRKVCHSRAEWRAMRENGREVTRSVQARDPGKEYHEKQ
ncbi:MAG: hypothetical protein KDI71_04675 [Xanthomonadales bacterium]|nr:hypothetical protein [Xanthomonadales bacterium]